MVSLARSRSPPVPLADPSPPNDTEPTFSGQRSAHPWNGRSGSRRPVRTACLIIMNRACLLDPWSVGFVPFFALPNGTRKGVLARPAQRPNVVEIDAEHRFVSDAACGAGVRCGAHR